MISLSNIFEKRNTLRYSVVVPVYNEKGNITALDEEIKKVFNTLGGSFEIIYVDDVSTDGSAEELSKLKGVTIITLMRNYGQATALDAGFRHAVGDIIITLDGDGQNNPADIPSLLKKMEEEKLDVVTGYRKNRQDKKGIRILTVMGRKLRHFVLEDSVHDTGCTLRVYTRDAVKSLDIGGEMHRYILALLTWKGFRIGEVVVHDRPRVHGVSKYNYSKAIRGSIDLVYVWFIHKYSQRPLHLFGYLSFSSLFLGFLCAMWTAYCKVILDIGIANNGWALVTFFFLLAGIILFSFGIVLEILIRVHLNNSPHEKRYYVREVITNK